MSKRIALFTLLLVVSLVPVVAQQPAKPAAAPLADNPLLKVWSTPFGVPPFSEIKAEHFVPAIKEAIAQQRMEVDAIATSPQPATFANTIEALENAGDLLGRVSPVFSNLQSSNTNAELRAVNREVAPLLSALRDDSRLNPRLWERIKAVWDARATLKLPPVQAKLLEEHYKSFRARRRQSQARAEGAVPRDHYDQYDTKVIVAEPAALRAERAHLLGYKSYADFVLEENMAKTPDEVYALLNQLWRPARDMSLREAADQQALRPYFKIDNASLAKIQLPSDIVSLYRSTYFNHIFGPCGGYASAYYAYIWSEVLDQDAFQAFREKGLFDQETARGFRTILEKGGTEEAMALYKAFRGREPSVEPLLEKRGLK